MELLNLHVALELSKEIAKTGTFQNGIYTLTVDGFVFTYKPDAKGDTSIEVFWVKESDPFICDWVDKTGHSEPCRLHLTRYDFPKKIMELAIQKGIIKIWIKQALSLSTS